MSSVMVSADLLQTNRVAASVLSLGSTTDIVCIPNQVNVNNIYVYSGLQMTLGDTLTLVNVPGTIINKSLITNNLSTNMVVPASGNTIQIGNSTTNLQLPAPVQFTASGNPVNFDYEEYAGVASLVYASNTYATNISYNVIRAGRKVTVWISKCNFTGIPLNTVTDLTLSGYPSRFLPTSQSIQLPVPGWTGTLLSPTLVQYGVSITPSGITLRASQFADILTKPSLPSSGGLSSYCFSYLLPLS